MVCAPIGITYHGCGMASSEISSMLRTLADSPLNRCFVCGPGNPVGLHMSFEQLDGKVMSEFVPDDTRQGWEGLLHGGIIASILDEAMAYSLFFEGIQGLTGRMEVRYRTQSREGDRLRVEASIIRDARRISDVEARIFRDSDVIAESTGRFVKAGALTLDVLTSHLSGTIT